MQHLKRTFRALAVAGASTAAVLAVSIGPASAAPGYTVTTGGSTTGTTAVTASGSLAFEDTYLGPYGTSGNPRIGPCGFSSPGTANNGGHTFAAGTVVTDAFVQLTPTPSSFSGCTSSIFGPVSVVPAPLSVWRLGLTAKTATGGSARMSGVNVRFRGTAGSLFCQADISGYLGGTYSRSSGTFTIDSSISSLIISGVTQAGGLCDTFGIFAADPVAAAGAITITPAPQTS